MKQRLQKFPPTYTRFPYATFFRSPLLATDIPCPLHRSDVLLDRAQMNVRRLRDRGLGRKGLALRRPPFARQIHDDVEIERRQHELALIFDDDARQCSPA